MKRFVFASLMIGLAVSYQNCGTHIDYNAADGGATQASVGDKCENILASAYKQTYYSTFRSSCTSCHDHNGESGKFFASANFREALDAFKSVGRSTVEAKAQNPSHKPPRTGPQHTAMIQAAQSRWTQAESSYANCKGSSEIVTSAKPMPAAVYTTTPNDATATIWPQATFQLATDVLGASNQGKVMAEVTLEIRRYMFNGAPAGYEFRRPRVRITSTATPLPQYRFQDLRVMVNGVVLPTLTLFGSMDFVAGTSTAVEMMPGVGYAFALHPLNNTDTIQLKFGAIKDGNGLPIGGGGGGGGTTLPDRVSYADLISANPTTGIFNSSCISCHRNGNAAGGLNLQVYSQAFASRNDIQIRVNNPANPMPPGNFMSQDKRSIIDIWLSSGAPQN